MNLTVSIPDDLYRRAVDVAAAERVSVHEMFAATLEDRVAEFEWLKARAACGSYEKFLAVMSQVPASTPQDEDRLQ